MFFIIFFYKKIAAWVRARHPRWSVSEIDRRSGHKCLGVQNSTKRTVCSMLSQFNKDLVSFLLLKACFDMTVRELFFM